MHYFLLKGLTKMAAMIRIKWNNPELALFHQGLIRIIVKDEFTRIGLLWGPFSLGKNLKTWAFFQPLIEKMPAKGRRTMVHCENMYEVILLGKPEKERVNKAMIHRRVPEGEEDDA